MNTKPFLTGLLGSLLTTISAYAETPAQKTEVKEQPAASGSIELMTGNKAAIVDMKFSFPILPRLLGSNRNLFAAIYETEDQESLSSFHVLSFNYNIFEGLDFLTETDISMPQAELDPRIGLQYFKLFGNFEMFNYASFSPKRVDVLLATNLSYDHHLTDLFGITANLEAITYLGQGGHDFSAQKLRLGTNLGGYQFGPAADLNQTTSLDSGETTFDYNLGGFAKKGF